MNISCLDKYQGNYSVKLYVAACLGIVGEEVSNYWRKRGTCGAGEGNIFIVVFPNDPIGSRSNT